MEIRVPVSTDLIVLATSLPVIKAKIFVKFFFPYLDRSVSPHKIFVKHFLPLSLNTTGGFVSRQG